MKIPELSLLFCLLNDKWVFLRVESKVSGDFVPGRIRTQENSYPVLNFCFNYIVYG